MLCLSHVTQAKIKICKKRFVLEVASIVYFSAFWEKKVHPFALFRKIMIFGLKLCQKNVYSFKEFCIFLLGKIPFKMF